MCEVSDGSINISHKKKCQYIKELSTELDAAKARITTLEG